jgi:uncharacterized membrane protein
MAPGNENLKNAYIERGTMIRFIQSKRHILTIVLALIAVGIEYYYSICENSCSYLQGDIFGIGLQYVGIAFMVCTIVLSILKKDLLLLFLLSAGVGVEIYLVGFQIWNNTYCLYCLAFGGVLVAQFFINVDWKWRKLILAFILAALLLFPIFFHGSVTPVYESSLVSLPVISQGGGISGHELKKLQA